MHRQSLGSPASKLPCNSGAGIINNNNIISEDHQKDKLASCSAADDEQRKSQKPNQQKSVLESSSSASKLIHLIPILTFFCFLILYLFSHDPSDKDLIAMDDNVGGGFMAIRSIKNLQQQERRRFNRKFRH